METLVAEIANLNTANLLQVGTCISDALTNDNSIYHGLCKERHTLFRSNEYGKTSIWQTLMEQVQATLKTRRDVVGTDRVEINKLLDISTSRWF